MVNRVQIGYNLSNRCIKNTAPPLRRGGGGTRAHQKHNPPQGSSMACGTRELENSA